MTELPDLEPFNLKDCEWRVEQWVDGLALLSRKNVEHGSTL